MKVTFPDLGKLVQTNSHNVSSPQNFIHVHSNVAIVISNAFILCFDIGEHLNIMSSDEDLEEEVDTLIEYFNNKKFTPGFWSHLTKGNNVEVSAENLFIETKKDKYDLIYSLDTVVDSLDPAFELLLKYNKQRNIPFQSTALPINAIKPIIDAIGKFATGKAIVFNMKEGADMFTFTISDMPHIFGIIRTDYTTSERAFMFDQMNDFVSSLAQ